jgi:hypothetical protein
MLSKTAMGVLSGLSANSLGVFRGTAAVARGVSRKQLGILCDAQIIERELPDVYRLTGIARSSEQRLCGAMLWAGKTAAAAGTSAGEVYNLEAVRSAKPQLVVAATCAVRSKHVVVHRVTDFAPLMIRQYRKVRVTGVEATVLALGHTLETEAFEIAVEDARRRRLTTVPALRSYLERFSHQRLRGAQATRRLLAQLDPVHASRSTLEVKTRRLLVEHGITGFEREFPLEWHDRRYRFDFAFAAWRTILETNGRRWHDDASDYERDNEKWSVPGRHGYKIVLATWDKVTLTPELLVEELRATLAGAPGTSEH